VFASHCGWQQRKASALIEARSLRKEYGATVAVNDLTFTVQPGIVTGFLGPNGSGKSTTMRMIVGLDAPTSGSVMVNGKPYRQHLAPLREVGALLEARAIHPGRSARNHLLVLAASTGLSKQRVDEVLDLVGLTEVASKRTKGFSLGMGQRLGIAAALLGDPATIVLDEPTNGLDPEGILWVRNLLRKLAGEGRTILVSSHLMAEMAMTADHLIVIGRGNLIADVSTAEFTTSASIGVSVLVRTPQMALLAALLTGALSVTQTDSNTLNVSGLTSDQIGDIAGANNIIIHELTPQRASLEQAFMEMTSDAVEYRTNGTTGTTTPGTTTPDATVARIA
jgi:ABC-2 type transport system ATP-binding protein